MPYHRIYHTPGQFTDGEKQKMAEAITNIYVSAIQLPAHYVIVNFIPLDHANFIVGGKANSKFVRFCIQHALTFEGVEGRDLYLTNYEAAIAPYVKQKGYDWEIAIETVDHRLWRMNGLIPPESRTETEKQLAREKASKA